MDDGEVLGGSDPKRTVKEVEEDSDGFYPGGDFAMELDLTNGTFAMEVSGDRIIIDENLGDFQYSPIVVLENFQEDLEITLL